MQNKGELTKSFFHKAPYNFNCAQTIAKSFQKEYKIDDELIHDYSRMGSGRAPNGECGAYFAARKVLSDNEQHVWQLNAAFLKEMKSFYCRDIRPSKEIPCKQVVRLAAEFIEDIMNTRKTIEVTAAIIQKDGQFLCAQRKKSSEQGGKWEFPGGKIEIGESPERCLERELMEEFGINTICGDFLSENKHDYGDKIVVLKAYFVTHIHGDFQLLAHQHIEWLPLSDIQKLDWAEADLPIVKQLISLYE